MADQDSILGTSGREQIPFEYQVEQQNNLRRRQIAQAMMAQGMKDTSPVVERFGRHAAFRSPWSDVAQGATNLFGQYENAQVDKAQSDTATRMGAAREAEISGVMALPEKKARIAQALRGQFGSTRDLGAKMQEQEEKRLTEMGKLIGAGDPVTGARFIQGDSTQAPIANIPERPPEFGSQGGVNYALTKGPPGTKPTITPLTPPSQVTVHTGARVGEKVDESQLQPLVKKREELSTAPATISNAGRIYSLIDKGAAQGGGAEFGLALQQLGAALGVKIPETGLTTENRSRYGDEILASARALAPVTATDVDLLERIKGSITTDPNAMKELLSWLVAKQYMGIDSHNNAVEEARAVSSAEPAKYNPFKVKRPDVKLHPMLAGRALQLMQESGNDLEGYVFDNGPASRATFQLDHQRPTKGPSSEPVGRLKR